jgi:hypothetical protein
MVKKDEIVRFVTDKKQLEMLDKLAELTGKNRSEVLRDLILAPEFLEALWGWSRVTIQGEKLSPGTILLNCFLGEIREEMDKDEKYPIGLQCQAMSCGPNQKVNIAKLYVTWLKAKPPLPCDGYKFDEVSFDEVPGKKYLFVYGPGDDIVEVKAAMLKTLKIYMKFLGNNFFERIHKCQRENQGQLSVTEP